MNILLTHGYFLEEDPKEKEIMRPYVPLGILYISAFLEKNGIENEIFDSTFSSFEKLKQHLLKTQPEIIGIYTNLMTKLNVLKIIRYIKETPELKKTKIILGGPEVSNHAENFLNYGADVIVIGEGEETMLELVSCHAVLDSASLNNISGIAYRNSDGEIIYTPERTKIRNIDDLPFPGREKVNLQYYFDAWKNRHGESAVSVSTMRGCPYTCKWCSRAVYGQTYRRRSASLVVDELEWIQKNYAVDTVWFVDDVFTISHKWMKEFTNEIVKRKLKIKYECITRADRMNEEIIQLLKNSGCFRVWIGAESGSQKVIDAMDRRVKVEQVRDMIHLSKKYGIQSGTFIMVGYPGETEGDIDETLMHLRASDPDLFTITIAYPIKGTPLYEEVENNFISQLSWENSTDRQIDFKRTYSRKYYDYAVRWINNEMKVHKASRNKINPFSKIPVLKMKSLAARSLMFWERSFGK
ncbi:MAG TPA: radical SAM protein [Bacteroidia bacterium]|nr:radical SAM protein [Bacteroidia bacterium]